MAGNDSIKRGDSFPRGEQQKQLLCCRYLLLFVSLDVQSHPLEVVLLPLILPLQIQFAIVEIKTTRNNRKEVDEI